MQWRAVNLWTWQRLTVSSLDERTDIAGVQGGLPDHVEGVVVMVVKSSFPRTAAIEKTSSKGACAHCEIRNMTFCGALNDDELSAVEEIVDHVRYQPQQYLFHEMDEARDVFNITMGSVKLYKGLPDGRTQVTGFVSPGEFIGFSSRDTYNVEAEAITPVEACRFSRRRLVRLMEEYPKLERMLLNMAATELEAAQDQMLLLGRKTAQEKLATFLLGLSAKAERLGMPSSPVILPMTRTDIGDYLGLTIETVSRTMAGLKKAGIIDLPRSHEVVLRDRERLEEIAEGL